MFYKGIVFDLDDTIWDFKENSILAIEFIRKIFVEKYGIKSTPSNFREIYEIENSKLWQEYRAGERTSKSIGFTRFINVAACFGYNLSKADAEKLAVIYLDELYKGTILVEGALETLEYLNKFYKIALITNGFQQGLVRLDRCNIKQYFHYVITSEEFGLPKPNKDIFLHTASNLNLEDSSCIYVGDNYEGDILGAKGAGFGAIYFNPHRENYDHYSVKPDYDIKHLAELKDIF